MKHIGNLDIRGQALVKDDPTDPLHVMRKKDVESMVGGTSPVYITDITPTGAGIVAAKEYEANTIPANQILTDAIANTNNIRVHVLAEGGSAFYNPTIDINGTTATLTEHATDKRLFEGYADLTMSEDGVITATSSSGSVDSANIVFLIGGPVVQSVQVDSLPGSQTAVKENDVVAISGVVENSAVSMAVKNTGAAKSGSISLGAEDSAGAGFRTFSGTATISNRSGSLGVSVTGTNFLGTEGNAVASAPITLDQTYPTVPAISVDYNGDQNAMKGSETALVTSAVVGASSVLYEFDNGTVASPEVLADTKTVTRTSGDYVTGNNYTITATRDSNGAVTSRTGSIRIANVAPTAAISISGNPARLRSSASGQNYTIIVDPDQVVPSAITLNASIGTWQGSWVAISGGRWSRALRITDADPKGSGIFSALSMFNEAGIEGTVIVSGANYEVGGAVLRNITFPAFAQYAPIGTSVANINKTRARYAGADEYLALRNDTNNVAKAFTIVDNTGAYDPNGDHLFLNDAAFAGSNTSGTLIVEFEEIV